MPTRWIRASDGLVQKEPGASSTANGDLVDWPQGERDGYVFTNGEHGHQRLVLHGAGRHDADRRGAGQDRGRGHVGRGRRRGYASAINANLFENGRYKDGLTTSHASVHALGVRRGDGRRGPGAARTGHAVHRRSRHGLLGLLRELPDRRALRRRQRCRRSALCSRAPASVVAAHHRAGRGLADGGVGPGAEVQHDVLAPVVGLAGVPRVPRRARDRGARTGLQAVQRQAAAGRADPRRGDDADRTRHRWAWRSSRCQTGSTSRSRCRPTARRS